MNFPFLQQLLAAVQHKKNPDKIRAFYEGWMKAKAEIQAEQSNKMKAAKLLGEFLNVSTDDAAGAMSLVYNANHGDNLNFFGLNNEYLGQKGGDIYDKMNKEFVKMKTLEAAAPYWRAVINTSAIQSASANLNGPGQAAEKSKAFTPPTEADKSIEAVASKPISINFNTGEFTLSENAKTIITYSLVILLKPLPMLVSVWKEIRTM